MKKLVMDGVFSRVARRACVLVLCAGSGTAFAQLPPVPVPPENPITEAKRVLGKVLFWDEQLSTSNTVACATCHSPVRGGAEPRAAAFNPGPDGVLGTADDVRGSPGVSLSDINNNYVQDALFGTKPQVTGRASNSFIHAMYSEDLFWDGRARTQFIDPETGETAIVAGGALESQAVGPPMSGVEMAHQQMNWSLLTEKLKYVRPLDLSTNITPDVLGAIGGAGSRVSYPELFRRAFGDPQITARRIAFAIATYERTLVADETPWDRFMRGDMMAMTQAQHQGWALFQGQSRCNMCHMPPHFTDDTFRNIGVRPIAEDIGRQAVTGDPDDAGRFKVPSLRNSGLRPTFMHNGQMTTMQQVMDFYGQFPGALPSFPENRDPLYMAIFMTPEQAQLIADFVSNALTDPRVQNQQFPFDRMILSQQRGMDKPTAVPDTGVAGAGGIVPEIIIQNAGLLGMTGFRVGLGKALGGAHAQLALSRTAPVGDRITPDSILDAKFTSGSGVATSFLTLSQREYAPGDVLYFQWIITDPSGPSGQAWSSVGRVPIFCGSAGCPPLCDNVDFNGDGLFPDTQDIDDFVSVMAGGPCSTGMCNDLDFNNDGIYPDTMDLQALLEVYSGAPCP